MQKKKRQEIRLTGTVYCDWNASFVEISTVPDKEYLVPGDLVVWSWSGDKRAPSSRSHSGVLRVSVIVGVRTMRRAQLHVHHFVRPAMLTFASDDKREQRLAELVSELRALSGRRIDEVRFGYTVAPADRSAQASRQRPSAVSQRPSAVSLRPSPPVQPCTVAAGESPLPPGTIPGVPRGRIKPGIRSEAPEPVTFAPTVGAMLVAHATKKRRGSRRKQLDPRQGDLF